MNDLANGTPGVITALGNGKIDVEARASSPEQLAMLLDNEIRR